jgi:hypothetical protein
VPALTPMAAIAPIRVHRIGLMYGQSRRNKANGEEASPDEPMTLLNVGFALKESSRKANVTPTR